MSDRNALKAALRVEPMIRHALSYEADGGEIEAYEIIVEAARRVAEADEVWWCQTHEATGNSERCVVASGITCDMVKGRLLLPAEEKK